MDLNVSPVPEEDEDTFEQHIEEYPAPEERIESAVDIARRVLFFSPPTYLLFPLEECICRY